ncbi:MAG TPA: hypothetical protein VM889_01215 [Candidatus Thermoplasmatota archaeon]|nr:hypothetical protein [Candidatus Thermoplasmatota archaeon]
MPRVPRLAVIVLGALVALVLAPPFVVDAAHREDAPAGCEPVATVTTARTERAAANGLVVVEERTTRRAVDCEGRASGSLLAARESYRADAGSHVLELTWRANGTKQLVVLDARGLAGADATGTFETYPRSDLAARTHRPLLPI